MSHVAIGKGKHKKNTQQKQEEEVTTVQDGTRSVKVKPENNPSTWLRGALFLSGGIFLVLSFRLRRSSDAAIGIGTFWKSPSHFAKLRAPMLFQDGRERVSCFIAVSWASSGSVHGRLSSSASVPGTIVCDPRRPSLRFGGGVVSLGFGVKVTVEVMAIGEAFATTGGGVGEAFPRD